MNKLLKFIELTRKFREVERKIKFKDGTDENDAEHSFQLAITAWYIAIANEMKFDMEKVLKYALAHDLVEAYAGDTPSDVHRKFEGERQTKHDREQEAAERIRKEFPEFDELHGIIEGYEKREDQESKFVYALDKIMPILNIYLDEGHSWKFYDVKIDDVIRYKQDKIAESPVVKKYFDLIIPLLRSLPEL
ncbi:HD domain-containing protein [Candidatus Parcubacteria bacterium]|nr:HD domain-containing protein [Candidatus Parcubacteria bacterium]